MSYELQRTRILLKVLLDKFFIDLRRLIADGDNEVAAGPKKTQRATTIGIAHVCILNEGLAKLCNLREG